MEIFVPGLLAAVLLGVAICYFVLPQLAPAILVTGSMIALALVAYVHYSKFGVSEYERSSWQNNLRIYVKYTFVITVFVIIYGFYAMNSSSGGRFSGGGMDEIAMPRSGGGLDAVYKTASSRMRELLLKGRISL